MKRAITACLMGVVFLTACLAFSDDTTPRLGLVVPSLNTPGYAPKINNDLWLLDGGAALLGLPNVFSSTETFLGPVSFSQVVQATTTYTLYSATAAYSLTSAYAVGAGTVPASGVNAGTLGNGVLISTVPALDGSQLFNLTAANLSGYIPSASIPSYVTVSTIQTHAIVWNPGGGGTDYYLHSSAGNLDLYFNSTKSFSFGGGYFQFRVPDNAYGAGFPQIATLDDKTSGMSISSTTGEAFYTGGVLGPITASAFNGNGSALTSLTGENVNGTVPLASTANYANVAGSCPSCGGGGVVVPSTFTWSLPYGFSTNTYWGHPGDGFDAVNFGDATSIALSTYSTIGGGVMNSIAETPKWSTIGGGYENNVSGGLDAQTIGGGFRNTSSADGSTIAGGWGNTSSNQDSTVGGGWDNTASGGESTVSGGNNNVASDPGSTIGGGLNNISEGGWSVVAGGRSNTASGDFSTVTGGGANTASGQYSWAGGNYALAPNNGSFVWADMSTFIVPFSSIVDNEFAIRAAGGLRVVGPGQISGPVYISTDSTAPSTATLVVNGGISSLSGGYQFPNGQWQTVPGLISIPSSLTLTDLTIPTGASANYVWTTTSTSGHGTWQPTSGGMTVGNSVSGGNANSVLYENGSQNLAASSSLQFDGTDFGIGTAPISNYILSIAHAGNATILMSQTDAAADEKQWYFDAEGGTLYWGLHNDGAGGRNYARITRTGGTPTAFDIMLNAGLTNASLHADGSGNVGINQLTAAANLDVNGTFKTNSGVQMTNFASCPAVFDGSGNITCSSDERLKNIDALFTSGLEEIESIKPIIYHWKKSSGFNSDISIAGFSAQNVQKAIPEAVHMKKDGYLSLLDQPIEAALVNAVKELKAANDALEKRIEALEADR